MIVAKARNTCSLHTSIFLTICTGLLIMTGCSRGPERVEMPSFDPEASAEAALKTYDRDSDGLLTKDELANCPGILSAFGSFDSNKDEMVSGEEIADRIRVYIDRGAGLKMVGCKVFLDGRPLAGATVELIPDEFLGEVVEKASGTSRSGGFVPLTIPPENLPVDLAGVQGVRLGVYRVQISHPGKKLPDRYVSGNDLGVEIGPSSSMLFFRLKSR